MESVGMSINCWEKWLFFIPTMWHPMKMPYCYTVWFSGKIITFKPGEWPRLCSERTERNQTSSVGTSWSTTSIKWISYCLLTHRVTIVHAGFTLYHISKWTGYEVHLNLLPFSIPAETIMHICQAAEAVTCQVTTWPFVSWGWLWVMR